MTEDSLVQVFVVAGTIAGGLALVGVLAKGGAWLWRTFVALKDFLDDWKGEPARPGVEARPGVPERITRMEAELHPNHGTSLRDVADRLEESVRRVEDGLAEHLRQHRDGG
ncbi:hypothetical protein [Nonomuraea sp. NPDC050786]|uniref:hypothetical protein n=1 Tax=Nonomuraea sp. NPDC050786 TaxID=3154840 RepID=UPI0033E915E8